MADFHWPGQPIEALPFEDGAINTRIYDTYAAIAATAEGAPNYDGLRNTMVGSPDIYDFQSKVLNYFGFAQLNGAYPVHYSIMGEGREVYFRVVGEPQSVGQPLGVVLQVLRVATRRLKDGVTWPYQASDFEIESGTDEPNPVGSAGTTAYSSDQSRVGEMYRRAAAVRVVLEAGVQYTIRVANATSRVGHGTPGQPGYDSGNGEIMYFEAGYADLDVTNDMRRNALDVLIYNKDEPYQSFPILNNGFTRIDHIEQVLYQPDPATTNGMNYTAWWVYKPQQFGNVYANVDASDQTGFPLVIFAFRLGANDTLTYVDVSNSGKEYVSFTAQKGETYYFLVGHYEQNVPAAQRYALTVYGPVSQEVLQLRMKDTATWERLTGGPISGRGKMMFRADDVWYEQVRAQSPGSTPMKLRLKDNRAWETVLWFTAGDKARTGRFIYSIDDLGQYRFDGISLPQGYVSSRTNELSRWTYNGPDGDGHYYLVSLIPGGEQTSGVPAYFINALARSAKGWTGSVGSNDFGIDVRYKEENLGWYALPLGGLLARSAAFLLQNGVDAVLNRVEITHTLYGWSVDKSQMPWMNFYNSGQTTNGLYPGVGALRQLPKQQLSDYQTVKIQSYGASDFGGDVTVPYIKQDGRPHAREDGVILWTGDLNDLGTQGLIHGLTHKDPIVITQTLTPAFVGNYTTDDTILYEIMTSDLPDPDPMSLAQANIYHTIENVMNHYIGVKIIYNVPE